MDGASIVFPRTRPPAKADLKLAVGRRMPLAPNVTFPVCVLPLVTPNVKFGPRASGPVGVVQKLAVGGKLRMAADVKFPSAAKR